ncbi:MAG: hypothetical protein U1G07_20185 [Verrucomicrobiota bacterium]
MKYHGWILTITGILAGHQSVLGNIIFSQDFSSFPNGPIAQYVSATPTSGQWNTLSASGSGTSITVANGGLTVTRGTSGGSGFSRTTDFTPTPESLMFKFSFSLNQSTAPADTAAVWQVGSGFSSDPSSAEPGANVHSQFALRITDTKGSFTLRDPKSGNQSSVYTGGFPITWVINNSAGPLEYTAPNGTSQTVGQDRWDLWYGGSRVLAGQQAETPGQSLSDIKFAFASGSGAVTLDNISINNLSVVPEPAMAGTVTGALVAVMTFIAKMRRNTLRRQSSSAA